jgi:transcriptional regulator with XRE-family HTH domain
VPDATPPPSPRRAVEQQGMNLLQRRLDDRRRELGLTYRQLGEKAGLPHSTARWLIKGPMRSPPKREQLEGLARALGLRLSRLQQLVGEVFGFYVYTPRSGKGRTEEMDLLIASVAELTPRELAAVQALVDELRRTDD